MERRSTVSNVNEDLKQFVHQALVNGQSRQDVEDVLRKAQWPDDQIKKAVNVYAEVDFPIPVPKPAAYTSAKETFLYLVLFTTLIISAISVGNLIIEYIDRVFPQYGRSGMRHFSTTGIRMSLALTIIAFPIYVLFTWLIHRRVKADPSNRSSKIRKWLTYITLFIAAGFVIGDLTALVFRFLSGAMTVEFILKILTVGIISGTIFGYYIWDLNRDEFSE